MLKKLEITNYRSIANATVELRPFTLLVGANGSGKSNLLRLLTDLTSIAHAHAAVLTKHFNRQGEPTAIGLEASSGNFRFEDRNAFFKPPELRDARVFSLNADRVGGVEPLVSQPHVSTDGTGAIQVLDSLKTGDREDLFGKIESALHQFVPEIEKLSFAPGNQVKSLQVRERNIKTPVPVSQLSEGTRLVLTILTIVFQERKPAIICLEDIDRGIHPHLFGQVIDLCRNLVRNQDEIQIIATTHNPYLIDQFIDDPESVLVVEKVDGNTSFTKLSEKLKGLEGTEESLGGKWYSGLVGGVPERPTRHAPQKKAIGP